MPRGGQVFSSGANLQFLHRKAKDPATRAQAIEYFREEYYLAHLISTYTKPVRGGVRARPLFASLNVFVCPRVMPLSVTVGVSMRAGCFTVRWGVRGCGAWVCVDRAMLSVHAGVTCVSVRASCLCL